MKIQKPDKQNAALTMLRRITSPSMALAITMALGGAMASSNAEETDNLPGMEAQPAEYFYTGKPYDADSGSYTFRYRNYDPELNRWTTADPSGFPDGANNLLYVNNPITTLDALGLTTVSSIAQALDYWRRPSGSTSDVVTAGSTVINNLKNSAGFSELIFSIQTLRIQPQLRNVDTTQSSGYLDENQGKGPASLGFIDLVIGRSSISYSDFSSWSALSGWIQNSQGEWGRWVLANTDLFGSFSDLFDFQEHLNDSDWMNLLEETLPGWYAGDGTPFAIEGSFTYNFDTFAWQYE